MLTALSNHLRDNLRHATDLRAEFGELVALHDDYLAACTAADRARVGARMADLAESIAEHLESSSAARAFVGALTPAGLRADAAAWRRGEDIA